MDNSAETLKGPGPGPSRVRTGEFDEPFAWNANKRRRERQPIRVVPRLRLRPTFSSHNARKGPWCRLQRNRTKSGDDENPEQKDEFYIRPIQSVLDIQVPCHRFPLGSRNPLLFLTTREPSSSSPQTGDIRWLHVQHSGLRFEEFINISIGNANSPPGTKAAMKDWLFGLQLQLETSIHSGMTFPGTARGAMFASTDENKDSRVEDTCVFFTLPYFLLSEGKFPRKGTQTHPVRSLVETLYRNESPFSREFRQAVNQLDSSATSKIIYVPQVWCLIINDEYVATSAPSQLHTHPASSIVAAAASEYPACVRLHLRWGLTFCIKLEECETWFDFLLRVHNIYSRVLLMHVDAESCTYWRGSLQVDAHRWASIIQNENTPGTLIDIKVLLPDEGTRWEVSVRRTIQHGFQDTSGLPSEKVKLGDDIREESLRAFDVLYPVNGSGREEIDIGGKIPPSLLDRIIDHTETRRMLQGDDRPPRRRRTSYRTRRRFSYYSDSEDQEGRPSTSEYDSDFSSSYSPVRKYVGSCSWPGCSGKFNEFKRLGYTKPREDLYWVPFETAEIPPPVATDDKPQAYLEWPVYSKETPYRHGTSNAGRSGRNTRDVVRRRPDFAKDAVVSSKPGGNASGMAVDTSPMAQLHRSLSNTQLYKNQETRSTSEINTLTHELISAGTADLAAIAADTKGLIEHFVPVSKDSLVEQKAFGALCGILEELRTFDQDVLEDYRIDPACKEIEQALAISQSIRDGIHGRQNSIYLLKSLVKAFETLVLRLVSLNDDLQQKAASRRKIQPASDTSDEATNDARSREGSQSPPPSDSDSDSGSDSSASEKDITIRRSHGAPGPRSPRPYRNRSIRRRSRTFRGDRAARPSRNTDGYRMRDDFQRVKNALEKAKTEILQLLESEQPLDLASYTTVNASGILSSVITSLVHGDCDLALPLSPENSYLSSVFTTSAFGDSDSTIRLDIGAIYQEYCSRLRLVVREHPTRNLLDDLDLVEEELDSIVNTTETQQRVIRAFQKQSPQRPPTQNAWVVELNVAHGMLGNKIGLYKDLKVQVDKLRRQVTLQIELKQDNNGKAILVFTTVTVIFLPLSFMTSYFGMNTPGISDMDTGQWIFWAISVPLTIAVMGFCTIVAYQGQKIKEYFRRL